MKIIKNQQIVEDNWQCLIDIENANNLPTGQVIVPLPVWLTLDEELKTERVAFYLNGDDELESIIPYLDKLPLIALHFISYTDGRGYSLARTLRQQYHYEGELRAVGDVMRDQLLPMYRCGINSFALREGSNFESALAAFTEFSARYQSDELDEPLVRHLR